jgi:rare lipoprotein A
MRFCCYFLLLSLLFLNVPASAAHTFTGKASWYGKELHGRRTASGERFDMHKLTAAHRTLPFGTKLLVKNHRTGKTCVVTVNDRGPHRASRCIDISHAAAREIGMWPNGEGHVTCTVLGKGKHALEAAEPCLAEQKTEQKSESKSRRKHGRHRDEYWSAGAHPGTSSAKHSSRPSLAVPPEVASAWQSL